MSVILTPEIQEAIQAATADVERANDELEAEVETLRRSWDCVEKALAYDEFGDIERRPEGFIVYLRHGAEGQGSTVRKAFEALGERLGTLNATREATS